MKLAKRLLTSTVLSVSLCLSAQAATNNKAKISLPSGYEQSYIGIFVNNDIGSSFYGVVMNKKEQPYLPIADTLKNWLELQVTDNNNAIVAVLQSKAATYTFNKARETLNGPDGKSIRIERDALVFEGGKYWLRYDYWSKWLPVMTNWNLQAYELYLEPNFELASQLRKDRRRQLIEDKAQQAEQKRLDTIKAIKPSKSLDLQARGRLDWVRPFDKGDQSLSAQYQGNIDIFGGTLAASGQSTLDRDGTHTPPGSSYWSYTLMNKAGFHRILLGDFSNQESLLVPSMNLRDGIDISRLNDTSPTNGFSYQGHTLPGTEINIFRNGLLIAIINPKQDANGNFSFNDPNGVPGDRYTFRFFYGDGTQANRVVQLSQNQLLEPVGKWNVILQNGYLDNNEYDNNSGLAVGRVTHAELWYGLTRNFSLGAEGYNLPTEDHDNLGGIDAVWQTLPTWSNVLETLNHSKSTDVSWQSSYTGFKNNTLQFTLKQQDLDSPINQLAFPQPFTTNALIPEVLPSASHSVAINDIMNFNNWQGNIEYRDTNVGDNADFRVNKAINMNLSFSGTLGVVRPDGQGTESYQQINGTYLFNDNSTLSATQNFVPNDNQTYLSYSRYSEGPTGWDYGLGVEKQEGESWDEYANVQWRFTPYAAASLTAQTHEVYLTLSLYGMAAQPPGPVDYNDFASGTMYGYVRAPLPNGNGTMPVQNAKIEVGGQSTTTDKNGHYYITGLPTDVRLTYKIEPSSLDADLIPDQDAQVVYFRPGTDIRLDPKIDMTAGLDGQLESNIDIPRGAKALIVTKPGGKIIQSADIEPNGFFVVSKLREKKYFLEFSGIKNPPKAQAINLRVKDNWLSNVDIAWQAPKTIQFAHNNKAKKQQA